MSQSSSAGNAASIVWSISFGDLLTLLVCFFLVLTPWDKLKARQNSKEEQIVRILPLSADLVGTNLAQSVTKPTVATSGTLLTRGGLGLRNRSVTLRAEIPLFQFQIGEVSVTGIENLSDSIKREVPRTLQGDAVVVLRICDTSVPLDETIPLVARMLNEVGIQERQLVISYPTKGCLDVATMRPVTERVVGSITIMEELLTSSVRKDRGAI
jgi:hypothetical protein